MKIYISILFISGMILLSQSCGLLFEDEPIHHPEAIFEAIWTGYEEDYAVFEERGVDWNDLYETIRYSITQYTSDDELFAYISGMLSYTDDGHVTLTAPGRDIFLANTIRREKIGDELFDPQIIRDHYLEPGYATGEEDSYVYGKVQNANVAYIWFEHVGSNFFSLHDFLDTYSDVNGYIIDLRHNEGGDFTYCYSEIGRLVDQERFVFRSKTKNGKGPDDFTPWHEWHIRPEGDYIDKPIVVLTDRYTISAGERAVMAFDVLPNVTLVGDTTNGAHGTMIGRELANGWFYTLVTQKTELPDGQSYEGIGIAPDVRVINTVQDVLNGTDSVLAYAIDVLK